MKKTGSIFSPGLVIVLGSVWGFSEAVLGLGLKSCAVLVSGSIMTGVAFFFLAAVWIFSRRITSIILLVVIASLFKLFDALLLSVPVLHGAVSNPIFAFVCEAITFVFLILIVEEKIIKKPAGQALMGGLAAVLCVNLFPLVKFVTGVPACTVAGTGYPSALYYIYVTVLVSSVTVPLGFWVGTKLKTLYLVKPATRKKLSYILSPATLIFCLIVISILRLA